MKRKFFFFFFAGPVDLTLAYTPKLDESIKLFSSDNSVSNIFLSKRERERAKKRPKMK